MTDRELGMQRRIPRRDFLDGIAFTGAALAAGVPTGAAAPAAYPPDSGGLVGQTQSAYAIAHRLRDHTFWQTAPRPTDSGEEYDLVVVGAGISGLSTAYFYLQRYPRARVLILDNLADFGGHAKRDEFHVRRRMLLANGGTQSLEQPSDYSAEAKGLLRDLRVETQRFYRYFDASVYRGLGNGVFFDRETFGVDRFEAGFMTRPWPEFFAAAPLTDAARASLIRVFTERVDYLPGLSSVQKRERLAHTSYADFLTRDAGLDPAALPFLAKWTHDFWGMGIDAVAALDIYTGGDDYGIFPYPGFAGMDLGDGIGHATKPRGDPYVFHFPDGNASVARLLVRRLIPESMGGSTMEDIVTARCAYDTLDRPENAVRIRLGSTVVRVRHDGAPANATGVEVAYVRGGALHTVAAKRSVLACWNTMVPYIAPELPAVQRAALAYGVKVPLVYTRLVVRTWEAFARLRVHQFVAPGSFYPYAGLDFPVSMGSYAFPRAPADPMALFLLYTPCKPGLAEREQHRVGRAELYGTSLATLERNARSLLARSLGGAGFDPARDILAVTVNRWAHGYAYEYNSLFDPDWAPGKSPAERGRATFHRIAIANSDSQAAAYTDAAIDAAYRAVTSFA
jgi:spermidine dehydrogenase